MPFTFTAVELCIVTTSEKPWTRAKKVFRALEYGKATKAADIVKHLCSRENYAHKYQLSEFVFETNFMDWPKDSRKDDYYTNEAGCTSRCFQANSQRQKTSEGIVVMCCFLMFDSSLVISYMRWKLKILQTVSRPLSLRMRNINRKF